MEKVKLCFFINTLSGGGAEKVLIDLLKQLNPKDFDTTLITISGGIHDSEVPKYIKHKQIVHFKNPLLKFLFEKIIYKMPKFLFNRLYMKGTYDIEIAYLEGFPTRVIGKNKRSNAAKIAFVHSDFSLHYSVAPLYKDKQECHKEYCAFLKVCFVSERSKEGFEETVGRLENARVVHNVVDYDRIESLSKISIEKNYQTEGLKLISVGRLIDQKGYDRLLNIISELEKRFALELWIVGEGENRKELENLIAERHIKSVHLLGYQINPYPLIKKADLFICSSRWEGYSTAVTEAVALGLPVLTTDCAGMDEILENGKYGIITENSEEALMQALNEILSHPKQIISQRETEKTRKQSLKSCIALKEYLDLFLEVKNECRN